ncbi:unnamed protein product [Brachionus calyciflorus]|uniref:Peptidase A2 domain-containing protein n=1 Tax=Brachionus calyciflorus TaxID=104777 RepID=A0A814JVQ3_9BILA|nr:unnamed protein product [Brachionus calyciflorus]
MLTTSEDPIGRIHGIAIMNGIKISYLCDSGADESILSINGFKKLAASSQLLRYNGPSSRSASGYLDIKGSILIQDCIIDPKYPLQNIEIKGIVSARLARWILRLNVYEFEIHYKPGKSNEIADALSRIPEVIKWQDVEIIDDNDEHLICSLEIAASDIPIVLLTEFDISDESLNLNLDGDLVWLIDLILKNKSKPTDQNFENNMQRALFSYFDQYIVLDGVLYFRKLKNQNTSYLYVLPVAAIQEEIKIGHCSVFSGHLGVKKAYMATQTNDELAAKYIESNASVQSSKQIFSNKKQFGSLSTLSSFCYWSNNETLIDDDERSTVLAAKFSI